MDAWKLAELTGTLYSLLVKVDVLAGESDEMIPVQNCLGDALAYLQDIEV